MDPYTTVSSGGSQTANSILAEALATGTASVGGASSASSSFNLISAFTKSLNGPRSDNIAATSAAVTIDHLAAIVSSVYTSPHYSITNSNNTGYSNNNNNNSSSSAASSSLASAIQLHLQSAMRNGLPGVEYDTAALLAHFSKQDLGGLFSTGASNSHISSNNNSSSKHSSSHHRSSHKSNRSPSRSTSTQQLPSSQVNSGGSASSGVSCLSHDSVYSRQSATASQSTTTTTTSSANVWPKSTTDTPSSKQNSFVTWQDPTSQVSSDLFTLSQLAALGKSSSAGVYGGYSYPYNLAGLGFGASAATDEYLSKLYGSQLGLTDQPNAIEADKLQQILLQQQTLQLMQYQQPQKTHHSSSLKAADITDGGHSTGASHSLTKLKPSSIYSTSSTTSSSKHTTTTTTTTSNNNNMSSHNATTTTTISNNSSYVTEVATPSDDHRTSSSSSAAGAAATSSPPVVEAKSCKAPAVHLAHRELIVSSIGEAVREMYEYQVGLDVALVSEDKERVLAHRQVLWACSSLLRKLLSAVPCECSGITVIIVTGTNGKDLSALIKSLYTGRLPSDCSLTGVNYTAQMLGLNFFVNNLQASLKDDINQTFLRRHSTEGITDPISSTGSVSIQPTDGKSKAGESRGDRRATVLETSLTPKLHDLQNGEDETPVKGEVYSCLGSNDYADKKGTKRKCEFSSTKLITDLPLSKSKMPRLDTSSSNSNVLLTDLSPLNLSKTSSTSTQLDKDAISVSQASLANNLDLSLYGSLGNYDDNSKALLILNMITSGYNDPNNLELYKNYIASAMNLQSLTSSTTVSSNQFSSLQSSASQTKYKGSSSSSSSRSKSCSTSNNSNSSSSNKTNVSKTNKINNPYYDLCDIQKSLTNFTNLTAEEQQNLLKIIQSYSPEAYSSWFYSLDPSIWKSEGNKSSASVEKMDTSELDTNVALNLSADGRDGSKYSYAKDAASLSEKDDKTRAGPLVWTTSSSSNQASSLFSKTAASYDLADTTSASAVGASANSSAITGYQSLDFKSNGLVNPFAETSGIASSLSFGALNMFKEPKKVRAGTEGSTCTSLQPSTSSSPEDGSDEIIEVLTDEDGSLLASYAGGHRRLLYHAGHGRRRKGCGACENCLRTDDCGGCRYCRDKAKFGGLNKLKQVCESKRCIHEPQQQKIKSRCGICGGCQLTADCEECNPCMDNKKVGLNSNKRQMCEMRLCEQVQMEEFKASGHHEEPSPYSTESVMTEAQAAAFASAVVMNTGIVGPVGNPDCPSPDEYTVMLSDKKGKKMVKKKPKDGKSSPPKARTKYQCNKCWGCTTTSPCTRCLYCADMPKHGGEGRYRQKCIKQLCILHPRLQSNKISVEDIDSPLQSDLEVALDPYRANFEAAAVTKTSMVNFIRLHHKQEGGDRDRQIAKVLEILAKRQQYLAEAGANVEVDMKEERVETPDHPDYSNDPYRASGSTNGSTPEPLDGGGLYSSQALLQTDRSRQLPDLRPLTGVSSNLSADVTASKVGVDFSGLSTASALAAITETGAALGRSLTENEIVAATSMHNQYQLLQLQQLVMQQKQRQQFKQSSADQVETGSRKTDSATIEPIQIDMDVDVEKVEPCEETFIATDLTKKSNSMDTDVKHISDEPVTGTKSVNGVNHIVESDNSEPKISEENCSSDVLDISQSNENLEVVQDVDDLGSETSSSSRKGRSNTRGRRSSCETRSRLAKSLNSRQSLSPVATIQTRSRSREQPVRRGRRKRTTRYSAGYYEHYADNEEVVDDAPISSQQPSDVEDELLKVGSEDDEEDARTADIHAAVQDVLNHELAEEEINRSSKQRVDQEQLDQPQHQQEEDIIPSTAVPQTEAESAAFQLLDTDEPVILSETLRPADVAELSTKQALPNDADADGDVGNDSSACWQEPDLQPQVQAVLEEGDASSDAARSNGSNGLAADPPPVPKLKLRLSNGPRAIDKVANYDINGVES